MPDKLTPLATLVRRLGKQQPPSLEMLISLIQDHQDYANFVQLIREFLPELHNAEVKETEKDGKHYVQFIKKVGTKG